MMDVFDQVLSPTYKSRTEDFKKLFKDLPDTERLLVDYSCALQKDILVHGRLYVSQNWICFYANIFRWETTLTIRNKDIQAMTKEKTARVIPNAIQISTPEDKFFFTSFAARDKTYLMLFRVWQNALLEQPMSSQELWQWVHLSYGEELGLTSDDEDYVSPSGGEDGASLGSWELKLDAIDADAQADVSPPGVREENNNSGEGSDANGAPDDAGAATILDSTSGSESDDEYDNTATDSRLASSSGPHPQQQQQQPPCRVVIDEVYAFSVDQLFCNLFSDSPFYKNFAEARHMSDIVCNDWYDLEDTGDKTRQVTYTMCVATTLGSRVTASTESQVMHRETKPGKRYMLRAEVVSTGFPYSDVFFVINHYCITKVSRKQCRLCVSCEVVYRKQTWGLVKSLIEKNSTQGMVEHFTVLDTKLREELSKAHLLPPPAVTKTPRRRRHVGQFIAERTDEWIDSPNKLHKRGSRSASTKDEAGVDHRFFNVTSETFMRAVLCILLLLVVVNVMFFYQLSSLEQRNFAYEYGVGAPPVSFPTTDEEWAVLLQRQRHLHELEIRRWRDVIDLTVKMVDQMQMSLHELKKNFETVSVAPPFDDPTQMP